jgi:hypothetical protein
MHAQGSSKVSKLPGREGADHRWPELPYKEYRNGADTPSPERYREFWSTKRQFFPT